MQWLMNAGKVLLVTAIGLLALIGLAASTAVTLLATGQINLDHVADFVVTVQSAGTIIGGVSLSGIVGILLRYGTPAYMEYRRIQQQLSREDMVNALTDAVAAKLSKKV